MFSSGIPHPKWQRIGDLSPKSDRNNKQLSYIPNIRYAYHKLKVYSTPYFTEKKKQLANRQVKRILWDTTVLYGEQFAFKIKAKTRETWWWQESRSGLREKITDILNKKQKYYIYR